MIGKVLRGNDVRRLLYYLYGPGLASEHTDPHLVAGFSDPADLEPERRREGSRDFRRLAGLLTQPLAALAGPGYDKPVWHCALRAAPQDRMLSDAEWAQVAVQVMDTTGLAPQDDELGVRWVAVRHAAYHVHLVATLARQDGARPRIWNDFYRVRQACLDAEQMFGLIRTAPADRTAARRATRAENEQAGRRGWQEPPRVTLHREVCTAAAGAGSEQEFFARLREAGVLVRHRHSTLSPAEVTGYAVGLPGHTARSGQVIWYGGGKLAADLTLPKLRARWLGSAKAAAVSGAGLSPAAARAVLRNTVESASAQAPDEAGFFAQLRAAGVLVRLRFSETDPGQVTGYSVTLPAHADIGGAPVWYSGGRLAGDLTLPQLRRRWCHSRPGVPERSGAPGFTAPERAAIYAHAADRAAAASRHIRRCAGTDPAGGADAAWAAADCLRTAARVLPSPALRCAADAYDRAARAPHGRLPRRTGAGDQLRVTARLLGMLAGSTGDVILASSALVASLVALTDTVAELRQAQQHAAQAAAARAAAQHLHAAMTGSRLASPYEPARAHRLQPTAPSATAPESAQAGLEAGKPAHRHRRAGPSSRIRRGPLPPRRAGPGR